VQLYALQIFFASEWKEHSSCLVIQMLTSDGDSFHNELPASLLACPAYVFCSRHKCIAFLYSTLNTALIYRMGQKMVCC